MTSTVTRYAEVYSEQYTDYIDVTSTLLGDRSSNNIIYFSMPASELILHPTYNSTITNLSLRIQEPVIGATASTTAEWMFTKDGITLSSSGWVGSYSYNYKAGLTLPVTWENAKTTGRNRLSITIDPSSSLIRSQDYGNLYNTLWNPLIFDRNMTVTINGVNANVSFDGKTIIVSQTFIPKLNANAEMKTNIVCETGTSLENIKAKLPNNVMVSTDMGNMWVPVSQWDITGYNPSVTGTYTAKGTFGFTSSTLSLNGFNGYVSASYQIVQGAVAVPAASVESGDYAQEKSVTLSAEDGAVIYYTLDGAAPTTDSSVYASALSMGGTPGETNSYTLKAIAVKNGVSSEIVEYKYDISIPKPKITLTVESFDTNPAYNQTIATYTFQFEAGESVTISAPDETSNNEQFVGWSVENSGGDIIAESNASSRTISFTMPQQAITLRVNYIPVVSKVAITMDAPASGQLIKSNVNSCVATVTAENNVDPSYLTVLWLPGDKSAAWNTEYSALVMLNEKAFTDLNFTLSDSAEVTVNGETVSSENIVADVKTGLVAMLVDFSATAKAKVTGIIEPQKITDVANGTAFNSIALPQNVTINTEGGGQLTVPVTWAAPGADSYDPSKLQQQNFTIKGTVTLPDDVVAETDSEKLVALQISVNAADQVKAPAADKKAGSYGSAISLKLTSDTGDAVIYYTLDGSTPTTGSALYTGEIALSCDVGQTENYTVKAIATKDGMLPSPMSTFEYTLSIPYDITLGKNGNWKKGSPVAMGFTCNGDISKYLKTQVDGVDVPDGACTVKSGSTIVTLDPSYLETLTEGSHTLRVVYTDGYAQTNFTILGIAATGDNSLLWLWVVLMPLAAAGFTLTAIRRKKNRKS